MFANDTKISEVVIRDLRDAWEVLFNYEIHDVFGDILNFFLQHRNPRDFEELCRALDKEQIREIFQYFLDNFDEQKVIFFFETLDIDQKEYFLNHLIFSVAEDPAFAQESSVIRARQELFSRKAVVPKDLKSAVKEAAAYKFTAVARFLHNNPGRMRQFIGELEKHHSDRFEEIIGGFALELMNYLPHKSEIYPEDNETVPSGHFISV
jgi:hypothetical protein